MNLYVILISKYGPYEINKDFVLMECVKFCTRQGKTDNVSHVQKCIEFVRYLKQFTRRNKI